MMKLRPCANFKVSFFCRSLKHYYCLQYSIDCQDRWRPNLVETCVLRPSAPVMRAIGQSSPTAFKTIPNGNITGRGHEKASNYPMLSGVAAVTFMTGFSI